LERTVVEVVLAATVACWTLVSLVWIVQPLRDRARGRRERRGEQRVAARAGQRVERRSGARLAILIVIVAIGVLSLLSAIAEDRILVVAGEGGLSIEPTWLQPIGLALLVVSTLFTIWARLALGTSWSVGPRILGDRHLRTSGPYAVTRHPIYTGLIGMLIGSALISGVFASVFVVVGVAVIVELKIWREEALLERTFPDEYPDYRRQVPQLIPGLAALRRQG
jgi:protein-S-isoprenylcysteine O-methyltransferase Ste14